MVDAGKYRTEDEWKIDTTKTKDNQEKQTTHKHSRTKLSWFSHLLQHSTRKWGGLILQCSRAHTGRVGQQRGVILRDNEDVTHQPLPVVCRARAAERSSNHEIQYKSLTSRCLCCCSLCRISTNRRWRLSASSIYMHHSNTTSRLRSSAHLNIASK